MSSDVFMNDPRVTAYELRHGCRLLGRLGPGPGQDGFALRSDRLSAVKFFDRADRYQREVEVYHVLRAKGIEFIAGHAVPELRLEDDTILAIEMSVVERPYLLDFAGAKRPDEIPDFEPHVWETHYEYLRELFGEHWTEVLHVAAVFKRETGFELLDLHPGNLAFADG